MKNYKKKLIKQKTKKLAEVWCFYQFSSTLVSRTNTTDRLELSEALLKEGLKLS